MIMVWAVKDPREILFLYLESSLGQDSPNNQGEVVGDKHLTIGQQILLVPKRGDTEYFIGPSLYEKSVIRFPTCACRNRFWVREASKGMEGTFILHFWTIWTERNNVAFKIGICLYKNSRFLFLVFMRIIMQCIWGIWKWLKIKRWIKWWLPYIFLMFPLSLFKAGKRKYEWERINKTSQPEQALGHGQMSLRVSRHQALALGHGMRNGSLGFLHSPQLHTQSTSRVSYH